MSTSVRLLGADEQKEPVFPYPPRPAGDFSLEINLDFIDDLGCAPWTTDMIERFFAEFKSWGIRRVHWIYYGRRQDGWWQNAPCAAANAERTMDAVGEIFPGADLVDHWIQLAKANHYDGYQYYECAAVVEGTVDGGLTILHPDLKEVLRKYASADRSQQAVLPAQPAESNLRT